MAEDRWYRVAVPILEFVHENGDKMRFLNIGAIADQYWARTKRGY